MVEATSSSSTSTPYLSPRLEQEIWEDDKDFAMYGGDEPEELHPNHHRVSAFTEDDRTAVNTVADHDDEKHTSSSGHVGSSPDPDLVDWDSPTDPNNPQNLSKWKKLTSTGIVTLLTLNVTLASSAPTAATFAIASQFSIPSEVSILVTSLFLVGYVIGPLLWSGLSELFGRRPVFIYTVLLYTLFILGQALAQNATTILVTRFFGGLFASAPLTNGGGFIADVWDPIGRGTAVAVFAAAVFIGPIVGPIMGAFVTESSLGWRWIFWITMIFSAFCWLLALFFLPETFAPVILQRKAKALRKADPEKNANKYAAIERQDWSLHGVLQRTIFRPFTMLVQEPILVLITIYLSLVYGLIYALFEVFPIVFVEVRGIKPTLSGLTFIGVGIGTTIGSYVFYLYGTRKSYVELTKKWRGHPPPEERLNVAIVGGPLLVVSIFWLCWTGAYKSVPWYVVELSAIPLGYSIMVVFIAFQSYVVDTYLMYSASALAGNAVIRSAAGAAFPLFTNQMFHNLGIQWAGTLLGGIALLLAPMPFVFWRYGAWVRTKSKFAPCVDLEIKEEIEAEERKRKGAVQDA